MMGGISVYGYMLLALHFHATGGRAPGRPFTATACWTPPPASCAPARKRTSTTSSLPAPTSARSGRWCSQGDPLRARRGMQRNPSSGSSPSMRRRWGTRRPWGSFGFLLAYLLVVFWVRPLPFRCSWKFSSAAGPPLFSKKDALHFHSEIVPRFTTLKSCHILALGFRIQERLSNFTEVRGHGSR
ncbi:hypothetical protein SEVIR_4G264601v4 [Setaria viridis]